MENKFEEQPTPSQNLLEYYGKFKDHFHAFRNKFEKFIIDTPELFYEVFPDSFSKNTKAGLITTVNTMQEQVVHFLESFRRIEENCKNIILFGVNADDLNSLIVTVNAFCFHVLYILMNINTDQYETFKKLGLKLFNHYSSQPQYTHLSEDNEKLVLLWFRHYSKYLTHLISINIGLGVNTLVIKHEELMKLYKSFCRRIKFFNKTAVLANEIAILTNSILEEHYFNTNTAQYYSTLMNLYQNTLRLDSEKNPIDGGIKNYLLSGIFCVRVKQILHDESITEYKKLSKLNLENNSLLEIKQKIFQNKTYFKKIFIQIQNAYECYQVSNIIAYLKELNTSNKKLVSDPLMHGSLTAANLITDIISEMESSLKLTTSTTLIAVDELPLEKLLEEKDLEKLSFFSDLLSFTKKCLNDCLAVVSLQYDYPLYYKKTAVDDTKKNMNNRLTKTIKLQKEINKIKTQLEILKKKEATNESKKNRKKRKKANAKKNENNNTQQNEQKRLETINTLLEKAQGSFHQSQYEDALNCYLEVLALYDVQTHEYQNCLTDILNCYDKLTQTKEVTRDVVNRIFHALKTTLQSSLQLIQELALNKENSDLSLQTKLTDKIILLHKIYKDWNIKSRPSIPPTSFQLNTIENDYIKNYHITLDSFEEKTLQTLREHNYFTFFIGGRVKDHLTKNNCDDTDIITFTLTAHHDNYLTALFNILNTNNFKPKIIGKDYSVIRVVSQGKHRIDINEITQKIDWDKINCEDKLEDIIYSILVMHAKRCNFTIDSIFYDPYNLKIIDFLQGQGDLKNKKLQMVASPNILPNQTLRALRFIVKYQLNIPEQFSNDLQNHKNFLTQLDKEKLYQDMNKLFFNGLATKNFQILMQFGLFKFFFPQTHQCMQEKNFYCERVNELFITTDKLYQQKIPLSAAFFYSALLWGPVKETIPDTTSLTQFTSQLNEIISSQLALITMPPEVVNKIKTVITIAFFGLNKIKEYNDFSYQFGDVRLAQELSKIYQTTSCSLEHTESINYNGIFNSS